MLPAPQSLVAAVTRYECGVGDDRSQFLPEFGAGSSAGMHVRHADSSFAWSDESWYHNRGLTVKAAISTKSG